MSWITIPEGKKEIRMADGNWTKIPEGMKEVDSSKLWTEPTAIAPVDKSMSSKAMEYLTVPNTEKTPSFTQGKQESMGKPSISAEMPNMEQAYGITTALTGRKYSPEQAQQFIRFRMDNGLTKNQALAEFKSMDATPLDMQNASYTNMSTKAPSVAASEIGGTEAIKQGLARTGLGVAQAATDIASGLQGLGFGVDATNAQKNLDYARGKLSGSEQSMENRYGMQSPLKTAVKLAPEILTAGINPASIPKTMAFEGGLESLLSRGEGFDIGQTASRAATASSMAGGLAKLADSGVSTLRSKGHSTTDDLSASSLLLANNEGLTKPEINNIIKGVPKSHQELAIAQQTGGANFGELARAATQDNETARAYAKQLTARSKAVQDTAGKSDFSKIKTATKREYSTMKHIVEMEARQPSVELDTSFMKSNLEEVANHFGIGSTVEGKIKGVLKNIQSKPIDSVDRAMDLYRDVNSWHGRAVNSSDIESLKIMKDNIKKYLSENISPEAMRIIDNANESYSRMRKQEDLLEILNKDSITSVIGKGSKHGEYSAVDWTKLKEELETSGLYKTSPEAKASYDIAKQYSDKFGDLDARLFGMTKGKGEAPAAPTLASSLEGAARVKLIRRVIDSFYGMASNTQHAQNIMSKAIRDGASPDEVLINAIKNQNTPSSIRARLKETLREYRESIKGRPTPEPKLEQIDKTIEASLRESERTLAEKSLAIDRIKTTNYSNQEKVYELEDLLEERLANDLSTGNVEKRLAIARNRLKESNESLRITKDKHSEMSAKFDEELKNSGYTIDNKGNYNPPKKPSTRSEVKGKQPSTEKPSAVEVDITKKIGSTKKKPFNALMEAKKNASEVPIGGSEDEARQAVINLSKKPLGADVKFKNMSKSVIAEIQLQKEIDDDVKEAMDMFGGSYEEALSAVLKERGLR